MKIDEEKAALRASAKAVRDLAHEKHGQHAFERIASHAISFADPAPGAIVSGFLPIRSEVDPRPLMSHLNCQGHTTALPVMVGKGKPLLFRTWSAGEPLQKVVWGIMEPPVSAPVVIPDIILVPLLAFDDRGFRVGYGGGFYDRTIESLRAGSKITTIGLAFDEQKIEAVPHLDHDEPLDWVLTPSGPLHCSRPTG